MSAPLVAGDACECPAMPVNYWRTPEGDWVAASDIGREGVDGAAAVAEADADRYNRLGCTAWVIACPTCHRIYAAGGETPR